MDYGKHVLLNVTVKDKGNISKVQSIYDYITKAVDLIGMTLIESPKVFEFPFSGEYKRLVEQLTKENIKGSPTLDSAIKHLEDRANGESGVTGICVLAESHISAHTYPQKNWLAIDIYSCKDFDENAILEFTKEVFNASEIHLIAVERSISTMKVITDTIETY